MKLKKCYRCSKVLPIKSFYVAKRRADGHRAECIPCKKILSAEYHPIRKEVGRFKLVLKNINARCNNKKHVAYKYYGGKGILNLLSETDIEKLWYRDKAFLLDQASIDRIDPSKNYEYSNCRFIEMRENARRASVHRVNGRFAAIVDK